eukprot:TRINITY_DN11775_c0_g1_i1.p1 TRINITY_DN11775_c0_g1~~TRINITY_DN11775_c0_g1_i1.p1  ORF type:complete len:322 (+),score=72.01 TRINITY_DN11775_c0_g1_i1:24-968(+)
MAGKDEDLDDLLDDALNDFDKLEVSHSAVKTDAPDSQTSSSSQKTQGSASAPSGAASAPFSNLFDSVPSGAPGEKTEAELTMQFASTMRDILKDVSSDPEILKLLDEMVPDGTKAPAGSTSSSSSSGTATGATPSSSSTGSAPTNPLGEDELQRKINEALEALNQHADNAQGAAGGMPDMDKLFEAFENNPEMSTLMDTMMQQMMSKDVLYEPLKELRDVFPSWMDKNRDKLSPEERKRHETQLKLLTTIVATYEAEGDAAGPKITTLMTEMQETGPFPTELLKEMSPEGMQWGEDGMPVLPTEGMDPKSCSVM